MGEGSRGVEGNHSQDLPDSMRVWQVNATAGRSRDKVSGRANEVLSPLHQDVETQPKIWPPETPRRAIK